jgi:uncharacterized protein
VRLSGAACRARLDDGRWHFQHGPIDLVIGADGDGAAIADALEAAWRRFEGVLAELVAELPLLRLPVDRSRAPAGPIAARMHAACLPHLPRFVTPMAAVAGSVADEIAGFFRRPGIERAYINNGGDIALHVTPGGRAYRIGVSDSVSPAVAIGGRPLPASLDVGGDPRWRGVATSGWRGRSQSLGIADAVTVLAATAAIADVAATLVANAVDVEDPAIRRVPAASVRADSDLGERLVTVAVAPLAASRIDAALDAGEAEARRCIDAGLVAAAMLSLQGRRRWVLPSAMSNREAA